MLIVHLLLNLKNFPSCMWFLVRGGPVSEKIYPCAYLLLPKKDGPTYMDALNVLASEIDNAPKSVSIDFEQAVIKACRDVFPTNPSVKGCRFHRKKNLYHQVGQKDVWNSRIQVNSSKLDWT